MLKVPLNSNQSVSLSTEAWFLAPSATLCIWRRRRKTGATDSLKMLWKRCAPCDTLAGFVRGHSLIIWPWRLGRERILWVWQLFGHVISRSTRKYFRFLVGAQQRNLHLCFVWLSSLSVVFGTAQTFSGLRWVRWQGSVDVQKWHDNYSRKLSSQNNTAVCCMSSNL